MQQQNRKNTPADRGHTEVKMTDKTTSKERSLTHTIDFDILYNKFKQLIVKEEKKGDVIEGELVPYTTPEPERSFNKGDLVRACCDKSPMGEVLSVDDPTMYVLFPSTEHMAIFYSDGWYSLVEKKTNDLRYKLRHLTEAEAKQYIEEASKRPKPAPKTKTGGCGCGGC